MKMTFKEINEMFTATVAGYLERGYTINAGTMSGSQGEIAKVDFTDGVVIYRVAMMPLDGMLDGIKIVDGQCGDQCEANCNKDFQTVWNDHLLVVTEMDFYKIVGTDTYGTREEAEQAIESYYKKEGC